MTTVRSEIVVSRQNFIVCPGRLPSDRITGIQGRHALEMEDKHEPLSQTSEIRWQNFKISHTVSFFSELLLGLSPASRVLYGDLSLTCTMCNAMCGNSPRISLDILGYPGISWASCLSFI
jgi:hypothetical protein